MAVPKVVGLETEYGISSPGRPDLNPSLLSALLVTSFVGPGQRARWDFEGEHPTRDARGFERPREEGAEEETGLASVILTNGARYYVDHAHPEYSTPECADPRTLVVHDKAGERILEASAALVPMIHEGVGRVVVYKNNTDGKGASYGCHENYLVDRATPFPRIVRDLMPFLVTRQVFTGSGRLGGAGDPPFQISQRAEFFEAEVGLETTLKRPIINTRDEPHADPDKYRRLHVIVGDANMSELATYLKVGSTALVLLLIEEDLLGQDLSLESPVEALHRVSRDLSLKETYSLKDGRKMRALDFQWSYLEASAEYVEARGEPPWGKEVLSLWERTLVGLERDPWELSDTLDWVAKLRLLQEYRERRGIAWGDARLALIDLQYHDVRREKGLYYRLLAAGRMRRLVTEEEVVRATREPPAETRAYFRGACLERFPTAVSSASWDSVTFDVGEEALKRVPMPEPLRGNKALVGPLLEKARDAAELLTLLGS